MAALDEVLARQLERGLDRLRTPTDKKGVADAIRRMRNKIVSQFLRCLRGEEAGVRIGEPIKLHMHGRQYVGMRMPETAAPPEASMYSLPALSRM